MLSTSLGPTAKPNVQSTGYVLPGIEKTGQLPRNAESLSDSNVADITTTFSGKERPFSGLDKIFFFNKPRRMSCGKHRHTVKASVVTLFTPLDFTLTYCVEAAFVDFIQDHNAVLRKTGVRQDLSEQTAVRHVLHRRVLGRYKCSPQYYQVLTSETQLFCGNAVTCRRSPVMCSRQSGLGSQLLCPGCSASPVRPAGPQ